MARQREITAKSILTKSALSDYSINCYSGCLHGCVYCYARYMRKFTRHTERWGRYLDVKVNAAELLRSEVRRKKPGSVFLSSACDPWQPAEHRYELTRQCLRIAADAGFSISTLTKSALVARDLDVLSAARECSVGCTITTLDESLRRQIEIAASAPEARIRALEQARSMGLKTWVFCGPLLPGLTDTPESIMSVFNRIRPMEPEKVIVDKLNFRTGVFESIMDFLHRMRPGLVATYRSLASSLEEYEAYSAKLRLTAQECARATGLGDRVSVC